MARSHQIARWELIVNPIASLAVLALGTGLSEIAAAADAGIPIGPPSQVTANNWSGLYLGVNLGGAWQSAPNWTYFNPNNGARFSLTGRSDWGAVGGLQGGYNWQSGALILGVEGDISRTSLSQTRTVPTIGPGSFARMIAADDWLASVRGRVGFVGWNNTLFYLAGGVSSSSIEDKGHMTRFIGAAEYVADAGSITIGAGWVVGGGAEWMVDPHVVVRLEYLYYDLDNNPSLTGPISPGNFLPVTFTWSNDHVRVVRAGLSYKF
jgi:outer membrane immunogenic protein